MSESLPIIMTADGPQPTPPADLRAALVAQAVQFAPGLSTELPGGLIEDLASTATGALVVIDQARVDLINSLTPYGANQFLLTQLGAIYGVPVNQQANPSARVIFSGTVGFAITPGFIVSDGTNQFIVQLGGIIESDGDSELISVICTEAGTFAIPADTITSLVTSLPPGVALTVTNPSDGSPGTTAQTEAQYRASVLQAGLVAAQGMPFYLRTLLTNIPGVPANLVSIRQQGTEWEIIVGGSGDPYAIGLAIFSAVADVSTLTGSVLAVTGITNANPGVVTTDLNHGFTTGDIIGITGVVGMSGINGTPLTITVTGNKTFSIGINTTGSGTWTSGGIVTPNLRNASVDINNYPDTYEIPYVVPPVQNVSIAITWDTSSPNFVSPTGIAQLVQPAIAAYVNALPVGAPINVLELRTTFINAVAGLVAEALITVLTFTVTISGDVTAPSVGTETIFGDPESYFSLAASSVSVVQV